MLFENMRSVVNLNNHPWPDFQIYLGYAIYFIPGMRLGTRPSHSRVSVEAFGLWWGLLWVTLTMKSWVRDWIIQGTRPSHCGVFVGAFWSWWGLLMTLGTTTDSAWLMAIWRATHLGWLTIWTAWTGNGNRWESHSWSDWYTWECFTG